MLGQTFASEHRPVDTVTTRNTALDGLRGYAAIMVAVFHCVLGADPDLIQRVDARNFSDMGSSFDQINWLVLRTFNGHIAVAIFFVLSGTVLFDSLRRSQNEIPALSIQFLIRRFFRIYPTLLVCLVITACAYWIFGLPVALRGFLENALLYTFTINGATWTLYVEMVAAPLMLLAFFGYRIGREAGLLIAGILLFLIFYSLIAIFRAGDFHITIMKVFWPNFLVGMLIPTRIGRLIATLLPRFSWMIIIPILLYRSGTTTERICAGLLIAMVYYGRGGMLAAFLQRPLSHFLGRISYSFYLYNVMFLEIICGYLRGTALAKAYPLESGLVASLIVIALTIPVAYASMTWIEQPFSRLGKTARKVRTTADETSKRLSKPAE